MSRHELAHLQEHFCGGGKDRPTFDLLAHLQEHFCGGGKDRPTFDLLAHLRSRP